MKKKIIPLDNDVLTRLIYIHDDEVTAFTKELISLENRIKELEEKTKSSQKVVTGHQSK